MIGYSSAIGSHSATKTVAKPANPRRLGLRSG
jgi:hypothetical protein